MFVVNSNEPENLDFPISKAREKEIDASCSGRMFYIDREELK